MVHAGAIVAARVTRFKLGSLATPLEVRVPSAQRNWVGIGCAAGVAAAFNSPAGGILYSLEEVCSHWSSTMTWRSFFCVVVAAIVFNLLITIQAGNLDSLLIKQVRCLPRRPLAHAATSYLLPPYFLPPTSLLPTGRASCSPSTSAPPPPSPSTTTSY